MFKYFNLSSKITADNLKLVGKIGLVGAGGCLFIHQYNRNFDELIKINNFTIRRLIDLRSLIYSRNDNYVRLKPIHEIIAMEKYRARNLSDLLRDNGYGIGDFAQILYLDASKCDINEINLSGIELKNLRKLNLANNNLDFIIWNGRNIKEINLANNKLTENDLSIYCENLKRLNLSGNKLQSINLRGIIKNIKYLDASNNNITDISGLKNLKNLKIVNLSNNPILREQIPAELQNKIEK